MRKLILSVAVSLDGFIEGPNGEYDWCFTDQDYGMSDFFKRIDTIFLGRKSYEMLLSMDAQETGFPKYKEYVFSTTLTNVREGTKLLNTNIKAEVEKIKTESGKDIWLFGGSGLTTSLINLGLVDEISMAVHPLLLGAGKYLYNLPAKRIQLNLLESKKYDSGLVILNYHVNNPS